MIPLCAVVLVLLQELLLRLLPQCLHLLQQKASRVDLL